MNVIANLNGKIGRPEELSVSVLDRGFLFGDGVYETGRSYERTVVFLEEHWERLRRSASKLAIPVPWSDGELTEGLYATYRAFGKADAYFRTVLTRGVIDRVGLDVSLNELRPTLVHIVQDLPTNLIEKRREGVALMTSKIIRNSAAAQDPNIKSSNYLNSLLALRDAKESGFDDAILCDSQGRVTEGTTFSVFGITATGTLITPALPIGILDSITRRHVLQAAEGKIPVEEGYHSEREYLSCSEVFIASSVREMVPVRKWGKKEFPCPGPITATIYEWLSGIIQAYVASHPKF